MADKDKATEADPAPAADAPKEPAMPTVRSGKVALRYIGKGAHTFGPDGDPLPAGDLDAAFVKSRIRTQRYLKAVLETGVYEPVYSAADSPDDDLPDDEPPRPRGG